MKTVNKIKEKKRKTIKKPEVKAKKEKVLIVAQEIKFARLLAGNEKKTRDRVLKTFKKWLLNCFVKGYEFKEDDFIRIWKGLFYAVWMSDKPLVQEELCETIAGILDLFPPQQLQYAMMMTKAGFKVLATEWYGIDHHRLDKFYMLVRRYLRGSLRCLRRSEWKLASCRAYAQMLAGTDGLLALKTPLYARNAGSMLIHVVDCFLEELAKVSEGNLPEACVPVLLRPFCAYLCGGEASALCVAARRLLTALLRQTDRGLEYQQRTRAWQMMGCPAGGPDALELISDDEDSSPGEENEDEDVDTRPPALDPRAGRVDVMLPPLPAAAKALASLLKELLATASSKAYRRTKICMERFEQLAADSYPLVVRVDADDEATEPPPRAIDAARELSALETSLVKSADELALRGLSRRHRKRLLAKARSGTSIVGDRGGSNGNWEVESTLDKTKKGNTDFSNKENVHRDRKTKKRKLPDTHTDKHSKKQKASQEGTQKQTQSDQKVVVKKSYEKVTKSPENKKKNKKQKTAKTQQEKKVPSLPIITAVKPPVATVKKAQVLKQPHSNEKRKKHQKDNAPDDSADKNIKKQKITSQQSPSSKNVLTKSNKHNGNTKDAKHSQQRVDHYRQDRKTPSLPVNKVKNYQKKTTIEKQTSPQKKASYETPKKVKFVLKNNSMQQPVDYYKSVRQSPNIPFDSSKQPSKTNLKVSTPSPINPFFKKKLRLK